MQYQTTALFCRSPVCFCLRLSILLLDLLEDIVKDSGHTGECTAVMIQTVLALALTDDLNYTVNGIIAVFKLKPDRKHTCSNKANSVTTDIRNFDRCIDIADLYIILFKNIGNLQIHLHRYPDISSLLCHTNLSYLHTIPKFP